MLQNSNSLIGRFYFTPTASLGLSITCNVWVVDGAPSLALAPGSMGLITAFYCAQRPEVGSLGSLF